MKVIMEYIAAISRLMLIGVALYGIFSICDDLRPQMESNGQYYGTFIFLAVFSFWNVTDWDLSFPGKKGENR